jgi:hypothetical protein
MNKVRKIKEVRGRWADAKRGIYLFERELERSYKKDPVGAQMLREEILEPWKKLLDIIDEPIADNEDKDFAQSLAGSNNFNKKTWKSKLDVAVPEYARLMAEEGIRVELVERRVVPAKLVESKGA